MAARPAFVGIASSSSTNILPTIDSTRNHGADKPSAAGEAGSEDVRRALAQVAATLAGDEEHHQAFVEGVPSHFTHVVMTAPATVSAYYCYIYGIDTFTSIWSVAAGCERSSAKTYS